MGLDAMYEGFTAEMASDDAVTLGERENININGLDGVAVTMTGEEEGVAVSGKLIMLGNDAQAVVILAAAETAQWDGVSEQVDAIVNSISLFDIAMPEAAIDEVEAPTDAAADETDSQEAETEEMADTESEASADAEAVTDYDTVFPLPADVQNFAGEGGEGSINYQTTLPLADLLTFYRDELTAQGLVERDIVTVVSDAMISIVFDGSENGKALVIQGVDLGDSINVNIRFEDM
jgi:hypothetical protein